MSKTVAVEFRGRSFWAFDVSLSILLREAVVIGARKTDGDWLGPVLADLRHAAIRGSTGVLDLDLGLTDEQRQVVVRLIEQAGDVSANARSSQPRRLLSLRSSPA